VIRNLDVLTDVCHSAKTEVAPRATEETASPETPSAEAVSASTSADSCEPPSDLEQQSHAASVSAHVHSEPNHAPAEVYLPQHGGKKGKTFRFQLSWYKTFPWLHHEADVNGVLCFYCTKAHDTHGTLAISKNADLAFSVNGFRNWKKAVEKFKVHQSSHSHTTALLSHQTAKAPITVQLSVHHRQQQIKSRNCLLKIFEYIRFLGRQGLALRGHEDQEGNLKQLLKLSSTTDDDLRAWLTRHQHYTSPEIQNEIMSLIANNITTTVCHHIQQQEPLMFSVIVDGTRDVTGIEQESICIRYVDENLTPREVFIGFYEASKTTGENIAAIIKDVLVRLQLPIQFLRGQTYDGAANMSGLYNGAQALIREEQPLALYVHCVSHCINLATEAAVMQSSVIRNSLSLVNELGVLSSQSGKFQTIFKGAASSLYDKVVRLRPLCPTRWTVRAKAIQHVLQQYESIVNALDEMSSQHGDSAIRAEGLLEKFRQGNTYLALATAEKTLRLLEMLNESIQSRQKTMSGMKAAVNQVLASLASSREDAVFSSLYEQAVQKVAVLSLDEIVRPRQRRPPIRYHGPAESFHASSPLDYFRLEYYKMVDTASSKLHDIVNKEGTAAYEALECCLLSGSVAESCLPYTELDVDQLRIQLEMFRQQFDYSTIDEAADLIRTSVPEVRRLFHQVEILLRLLLVVPVTSCEAERSFSSLRRLKTWLRSTMTQKRLNHVAVCNVHHDYIDLLNLKDIVNTFANCNERRQLLFGNF